MGQDSRQMEYLCTLYPRRFRFQSCVLQAKKGTGKSRQEAQRREKGQGTTSMTFLVESAALGSWPFLAQRPPSQIRYLIDPASDVFGCSAPLVLVGF